MAALALAVAAPRDVSGRDSGEKREEFGLLRHKSPSGVSRETYRSHTERDQSQAPDGPERSERDRERAAVRYIPWPVVGLMLVGLEVGT